MNFATAQPGLRNSVRRNRDRLSEQADDTERLLRETGAQLEKCNGLLAENGGLLTEKSDALTASKTALDAAREQFAPLRKGPHRRAEAGEGPLRADRYLRGEGVDDFRETPAIARRLLLQRVRKRIQADSGSHLGGLRADLRRRGALPSGGLQTDRIGKAHFRTFASASAQMGIGQRGGAGRIPPALCERVEELTAQRDDLLKRRSCRSAEHRRGTGTARWRPSSASSLRIMNANFQRTFVKLFGGGKRGTAPDRPEGRAELRHRNRGPAAGQKAADAFAALRRRTGADGHRHSVRHARSLKPTPFCILDEIEAALDDANIDNYADYLKAYSAKHAVRGHHPPQGHHGALSTRCTAWSWRKRAFPSWCRVGRLNEAC